jgi:hypothetical protein
VTTREDAMTDLINVALGRARAANAPRHVYCTATQWVIDARPPVGDRQHIRVEPEPPQAVMCEYDHATGRWSERVISTPAPSASTVHAADVAALSH